MFAFRVIFLCFITWLLVIFLPGHTRGAITLGAQDGDSCCAPAAKPPATVSCCERESSDPSKDREPSDKDVANCAVCHWAAGLLTTPHFILDFTHAEQAFEHARLYHAQVQRVRCRLNQFGRDPPGRLPDSIVV